MRSEYTLGAMPSHQNLLENYQNGNLELALDQAYYLQSNNPDDVLILNIIGCIYLKQSSFDKATPFFQRLLKLEPDNVDAHNNIGIAFASIGRTDDAIGSYMRALDIDPNHTGTLCNLGILLSAQGEYDEATRLYHRALSVDPSHTNAYRNLGIALQAQGKYVEAIVAYNEALRLEPHQYDLQIDLANLLLERGQFVASATSYRAAISINSNDANAHSNLGNALASLGNYEDAVTSYEAALEIDPTHSNSYSNLGVVLNAQGNLNGALQCYKKALELNPNHADAYSNLGITLNAQGNIDGALEVYKKALTLNPHHADAWNNCANIYYSKGLLSTAIEYYEKAYSLDSKHVSAEMQYIYLKMHCCDFSVRTDLVNRVRRIAENGATTSFAALPTVDDPCIQLQFSKNVAKKEHSECLGRDALVRSPRSYIRVGYFSSDVHDHATMALLSGLLRVHDKSIFEVYLFSYGTKKDTVHVAWARSDTVKFHDISGLSNAEVLDLSDSIELDIAVDLKGYTKDTRSSLFNYRLAPIQISYLGYPGSMGAKFIDYMIADPIVVPTEERRYYTENMIYLPHTYQPNDNERMISKNSTTRADWNLPAAHFVFCCFNNSYKIGYEEFDIWMRVLAATPKSVLWLLESNKWAVTNLKKEANRRGVDPSRLIFAPRIGNPEHLERHVHADLFLDTFNVNAHTTAADALWAGLPIVTKQGRQFAARVTSSLLAASGLPQLITFTKKEYEALIMELVHDRKKLGIIRNELSLNRETNPLFDTRTYTRNFEVGLMKAQELFLTGKEARDIWIEDNDASHFVPNVNVNLHF